MRPDDDARLPGLRSPRGPCASRPRSAIRSAARPRSPASRAGRRASRRAAGEQVRRREERALSAGAGGERQRVRGHRGLAGPDVALEQAEHRLAGRGPPGSRRSRRPGPRQADRRGRASPTVPGRGRSDLASPASSTRAIAPGERPRWRRRPTIPSWSASSSSKARRRRAASRRLERVRVVGLLERPADADELLGLADPGGQVLGIVAARPGRAPRASPPAAGAPSARPSAGRRARSARRGAARRRRPTGWKSGLSIVSFQPKRLSLPETMISAPGNSRRSMKRRPNHVASTEPGLVLEDGDRPLDPAAERRLDPDVRDRDAGADDRPSSDPCSSPSCASRAGRRTGGAGGRGARGPSGTRAAGRPAGGGSPRRAGRSEHRVEQLGRIGRRRRRRGAVSAPPAARARGSGRAGGRHPYSAAIR